MKFSTIAAAAFIACSVEATFLPLLKLGGSLKGGNNEAPCDTPAPPAPPPPAPPAPPAQTTPCDTPPAPTTPCDTPPAPTTPCDTPPAQPTPCETEGGSGGNGGSGGYGGGGIIGNIIGEKVKFIKGLLGGH